MLRPGCHFQVHRLFFFVLVQVMDHLAWLKQPTKLLFSYHYMDVDVARFPGSWMIWTEHHLVSCRCRRPIPLRCVFQHAPSGRVELPVYGLGNRRFLQLNYEGILPLVGHHGPTFSLAGTIVGVHHEIFVPTEGAAIYIDRAELVAVFVVLGDFFDFDVFAAGVAGT